jgi:hypothetical protein
MGMITVIFYIIDIKGFFIDRVIESLYVQFLIEAVTD